MITFIRGYPAGRERGAGLETPGGLDALLPCPASPARSSFVYAHDQAVGTVVLSLAERSAKFVLSTSGALPENVNYAVKSSFLLGFLESVPQVAAKLKEPNSKDMKFADVVEQAKEAAGIGRCETRCAKFGQLLTDSTVP